MFVIGYLINLLLITLFLFTIISASVKDVIIQKHFIRIKLLLLSSSFVRLSPLLLGIWRRRSLNIIDLHVAKWPHIIQFECRRFHRWQFLTLAVIVARVVERVLRPVLLSVNTDTLIKEHFFGISASFRNTNERVGIGLFILFEKLNARSCTFVGMVGIIQCSLRPYVSRLFQKSLRIWPNYQLLI